MKRKYIVCFLIAVFTFTMGIGSASFADDLDDQMSQVEQEKASVSAEMEEMTAEIESAEQEVEEIQGRIEEKEGEIQAAATEVEHLRNKMAQRQEGLDQRLRIMYKNGSVGFLDVLFGSSSISEFLSNIEMVQRIYKNDMDTLAELEENHDLLESKQLVLEQEKEALAVEKESERAKQEELEDSKAALQEKLEALNAEADAITAEIVARQKALEEQRRKEEAQNGGSKKPAHSYSGGALMWPCDSTIITSEFGFRIHPLTGIYTGHTGIDIGCSMNSPVYAAEAGTVILSEWYGGYGYAVVVDHGGGITTLYGHNDSLSVSVGDTVNRGDVVASSGNTGWSTGPHLHFEVRVNGEYVDPMGYF